MAIRCEGVTITWGGTPFQEVTSYAWNYGGPSQGRQDAEIGRAVVVCLGTANTSTSNHGQRKQLVASGGGQDLTCDAIWDSVAASAQVNGVATFTVTLRLIKD